MKDFATNVTHLCRLRALGLVARRLETEVGPQVLLWLPFPRTHSFLVFATGASAPHSPYRLSLTS